MNRPRRICAACGAETQLAADEDLWPKDGRCDSCSYALPEANGFVSLAPHLDDVSEGFDLKNFDLLPDLEAKHFWFVGRNELIGWLVRRYAPDAARALEIGCGTGFALYALRDALPRARLAGSELHSAGLLTARARHGESVELFQMDARKSGLVDAIDLIGAFDVLEHIPEDEAVLAEIRRMLKPGGIFIATVPQHPWAWSTTDDLAHHQRRYRIGELARKATAAGLEPVYQTSFTVLAFPLMVASRLVALMRRTPRTLEEQTAAEYVLSPTTSRAMLVLSRLEHVLRKLGLPMPFGGSQVLVARRGRL